MGDEGKSASEPDVPVAAEPIVITPREPPPPTLNTLAVVSLVAGVGYFAIAVGLGVSGRTAPLWLVVVPAVAVFAGYGARSQTMRNGRGGSYLALLGLVLGFVALALLAFGWALSLLTR